MPKTKGANAPDNGEAENQSPEEPKRRVAFLGEGKTLGTFGAIAAEKFFGQEIKSTDGKFYFLPKTDHTEVLEALWNRDVDYGVVAIENGVDGVVNETARGVARLTARGIHVMEEIALPVVFYFAAKVDLDLAKDITIYAHPQAKGQCLKLKRRLVESTRCKVKVETVSSNGAAARLAAGVLKRGEKAAKNCAAIVSWEGLMDYKGLGILKLETKQLHEDEPKETRPIIERLTINRDTTPKIREAELKKSKKYVVNDFEKSTTRFWKLGHGQFTPPVKFEEKMVSPGKFQRLRYNRTSILLNLDHDSPGNLAAALAHFSRRGCNLAIVYPIPIPGRPFEYSFLLEFEDGVVRGRVKAGGHIDHEDGKLRAAYQELLDSGISLNPPIIFGAYPAEILEPDLRGVLGAYPVSVLAPQGG